VTSFGKTFERTLDGLLFPGVSRIYQWLHSPRNGHTPIKKNVAEVCAAIKSFRAPLSTKLVASLAGAIIKHRLTGHELAVIVGIKTKDSPESDKWYLNAKAVTVSEDRLLNKGTPIGIFHCEIPIPGQSPTNQYLLRLALVSIKRDPPQPARRA
jgi:hypothetical protein